MLCRFDPGSGHQQADVQGLGHQWLSPFFFWVEPMNDDRLTRLLHRFSAAAEAHAAAMESMDEEKASRHAFVLQGLYREIVQTGEAGREELVALVDSSRKAVAGMAAVYSLRYFPERAAAVLRRLSAEEGLLGFRAGSALESWERGEWNLE